MDVTVTLCTRETANHETNETTQSAGGDYACENNIHTLRFFLDGAHTAVVFDGSTVTVRRSDKDVFSELIFEPGKRRDGRYDTPYGSLPLAVYTEALDSVLTVFGHGKLHLVYRLYLADEEQSMRDMTITF
ncbi:MAG: DUF1934 domain-containing protein [Clostridia bacterium]|nr:DUF1934 domain-containing protein [Clostridia bacterium]